MSNCIFCKIIDGEIPASKFWENEHFIAILDLFPNTTGASLVICKHHYESNYLNVEAEILKELIVSTKEVGNKLRKALGVTRVAAAVEGTGVDHLHIHMYPLNGLEDYVPKETEKKYFSDKYNGYITTQPGEMADRAALDSLADLIRKQL